MGVDRALGQGALLAEEPERKPDDPAQRKGPAQVCWLEGSRVPVPR